MKVLLAGYLLERGGIQSHMQWLSRALGEKSVEVLAISLGHRQATPAEIQALEKFQSPQVRFVYLSPANGDGKFKLAKWQQLAEIQRTIESFAPDIYLATGTGWNLFIPAVLAKTRARRIFFEVMSGEPSGKFDSRWTAKWFFDEVIGQSPTVAATFARCFGWKQPIPAIAAMPEPLELTTVIPQVVNRCVPLGTAKAALFSRLVPHKQAFWLVKQWDSLKDYVGELHIHGSGPEEALIRDYIAANDLGDRVKCWGRYPEGQAYVELLASYDLTLLPTIGAEGAPLVLLESMACGVPFVAMGVGGIPDYGRDNPNVAIVDPQSDLFIPTVKQMLQRLDEGNIDRLQLQQFYQDNYSYVCLQAAWLKYFHQQSSYIKSAQIDRC